MSSSVLSGAFENPCFVIDSELSNQSLQELGTRQIVDPSDATSELFECVSLSNSSEKCTLENAPALLTRASISTASSIPLEHLENFLSDARSSCDDSPVAALRRLSVVKFDPPEEDYPRLNFFTRFSFFIAAKNCICFRIATRISLFSIFPTKVLWAFIAYILIAFFPMHDTDHL